MSNQPSPTIMQTHAVPCMGDSMTAAGIYQLQLQSLLGSTWSVRNFGINGNTVEKMRARLAEDVLNSGDAEILVIMGLVNDLNLGRVPDQIMADFQAIFDAAASHGITVVVCTSPPFKGYPTWTTTLQGYQNTLNGWLRGIPPNVDFVVDVNTLLVDPFNADTMLAEFDSGDHLHPNNAGYCAIGNKLATVVPWKFNPLPSILAVSGKKIALNQSLETSDSPRFRSLGLGRNTKPIRALTVATRMAGIDEEQIALVQYNDPTAGWLIHADVSGSLCFKRFAGDTIYPASYTIPPP